MILEDIDENMRFKFIITRLETLSKALEYANVFIDDARLANMLRDLPGKKSQLDLRPFGVGVLAVGSTASP